MIRMEQWQALQRSINVVCQENVRPVALTKLGPDYIVLRKLCSMVTLRYLCVLMTMCYIRKDILATQYNSAANKHRMSIAQIIPLHYPAQRLRLSSGPRQISFRPANHPQ